MFILSPTHFATTTESTKDPQTVFCSPSSSFCCCCSSSSATQMSKLPPPTLSPWHLLQKKGKKQERTQKDTSKAKKN
jgi:hypothetical protein